MHDLAAQTRSAPASRQPDYISIAGEDKQGRRFEYNVLIEATRSYLSDRDLVRDTVI